MNLRRTLCCGVDINIDGNELQAQKTAPVTWPSAGIVNSLI
jgi:hypothetical protein